MVRRGWTVLARNYRFGRREVDLVLTREELVVFAEVKTRTGEGFGGAAAAITWRKRREIEAVAEYFLAREGLWDRAVRFDAVLVTSLRGRVRVEHLPDAWRPGWR